MHVRIYLIFMLYCYRHIVLFAIFIVIINFSIMANTSSSSLPNLDINKLEIPEVDKTTRKLLMIIEGVYGIGVKKSIEKYGYTEQRYYQLIKAFRKGGIEALEDKKTGPKGNSKRTDEIVQQIIRYKFLDSKSSAEVIAQKLRQRGYKISTSSVQRTFREYGLQKKTLRTKS